MRARAFARKMRLGGLIATSLVALAQPAFAQVDGAAAPAAADQEDDGIEDIVVTAQRREQDMQQVPIAIVATSADQLESAGITNVQQLTALVPSLNVSNIAGGVSFFLRGVGTTASQVENQVIAYVDDVYVPNQRTVGVGLMDVEQIAVLKGPQGTLFGRNATGGVIQITTRDPGTTTEVQLRSEIDNFATWRSDIFVGGPLADGVRASLMASYATQGEGWGYNPIANYETFKIDKEINLRGKLLFDIGSNVTLEVIGDYRTLKGTNAIIEVPYPGTVLRFEPSVVGPNGYYNSRGDYPNIQDLETAGVSADLGVDLGGVRFRSITAFRTGTNDFQFDADRSPTDGFRITNEEKFGNFSQEVQLLSPDSGSALTWVLGGYYFYNRNEALPFYINFAGPYTPLPTSTALIMNNSSEKTHSYAGFAEARLQFLPSTALTAGVRYTSERKTLVGTSTITRRDGSSLPTSSVNTSVDFDNWTFRLALDHRFSDDVMGFVSFDRGFKSGGYNIASIANPPFLPETLDAYQAGLKMDLLDNRLRLNTSVFYYDYRNLQVVSFTFVSQVDNGAAAEMYGIDVELEARPTRNLAIRTNVSLLHSEFTDYPNAVFTVPAGVGMYTLVSGDASGNRTPFAQPFQASLTIDYTVDTGGGELLFSGTNAYNAGYFYEADNNMEQGDFNLLNLSAKWTSPDDVYSVKLWTTNLLNERVGTRAASQNLGLLVTYGNAPRRVGVTVGAHW